ncbi:MAG: RyR domain-containing protein [Anaerolineales bacterium]
MESMRQTGWEHGHTLDEQAKTHPAIVSWDELNEDEREKDR